MKELSLGCFSCVVSILGLLCCEVLRLNSRNFREVERQQILGDGGEFSSVFRCSSLLNSTVTELLRFGYVRKSYRKSTSGTVYCFRDDDDDYDDDEPMSL